MTTEVIKAIESVGEAVDATRKGFDARFGQLAARVDGLQERVEAEEAKAMRPGRSGDGAVPTEYKRFETASGPVFELPSHAKMAAVAELRGQRKADISLERWLAATVAGDRCGDKEAVEYVAERKAMVTTSTGVLIPAEYQAEWIDLMRAQSVLVAAGMRTVNMQNKTQVHAAVTADPTVGWHTEGNSINAANPTFASRTLTATTLVARCQASLELAQDSPEFGGQLARVMTGAMAAEIDRVGLEGTGTPPQPRGIKNTSGRSSQTSVSTLTDYEEITSGIGELLAANCDLAQVGKFAIMSPRAWTAYQNLVTGIASDKTPLVRPESIKNMQFLVTSNIAGSQAASPQTTTTIYLGDFRDLLLGVRLDATVEVVKADGYTGNLVLDFVGYTRVDFLVTRPASFHTIEGVAA